MNKDLFAVTAANRQAWDLSARLHGEGPEWEALLARAAQPGFSVLDDCLKATLEKLDINGLDCAQVGCNNARELLSLKALGGKPRLGIDVSAAFLAQGRQLADAAGIEVELLQSDIYALAPSAGTYDLILITIGVLGWMPDLKAFFAAVSRLMAPGARLVIYETHPLLDMYDPASTTPFAPSYSYFREAPLVIEELISYDGEDHGKGTASYWFFHPLGSIVTECIAAGLALQRLQEHPHSNREKDYDIYSGQAAQMPMSYTLVAAMPT